MYAASTSMGRMVVNLLATFATFEREMIAELNQPGVGAVKQVGTPIKFVGQPKPRARPAPQLGEHTDQVLAEFGLSADEIAALRASHVI